LVQQCTFPTIFMQKLEKSTPGLLWVNTTPNRYYSYNISLESAYCPLKEALWISVHPLHVYSMFPSPLKYQYCLLPAILLIPFLWPYHQVERSEDNLGYNTTNMVVTSQRADGAHKIRYIEWRRCSQYILGDCALAVLSSLYLSCSKLELTLY